ncbi:mevalonate kinase [Micromonospora sp. WMMC264]|uniref:mevalonate kinase n=1 Tax=Micromonospora sp. WMMC264 TaxID=3015158 RepID=UPI00248BFC5F|nr:mevalonate kinase [Micromonospora sp. WMMC264]WBB86858.1 mevalonate kinase [Micromonospora sp. WMMC264]
MSTEPVTVVARRVLDDRGDGAVRLGAGRAHGKAILLGEHAVVYGAPALAVPVPQLTAVAKARRVGGDGPDEISFAIAGLESPEVTSLPTDGLQHLVTEFRQRAAVTEPMRVDVLVDCAIPQGRGLGSSAACARAAVLALADAFDRRLDAGTVFDLVQTSENVAHGRASGIDALATGATAPLIFRNGVGRELPVAMAGSARLSDPAGFDAVLVIADSGVSGSTRDAVELLRGAFERSPRTRDEFVSRVTRLTEAAAHDLLQGRVADFGARLTENHRLLRDVGVSTDRIDRMVDAAVAAGSPGAKISGGGLGGCMIALAGDRRESAAVVRGVRQAGAVRTWVVPMGRFAGHDD